MGQYKNLMAILDTTKDRKNPLRAEIRGKAPDFILAITDGQYTLATSPFQPGDEDLAAEDVARSLTLDGNLPPGMAS